MNCLALLAKHKTFLDGVKSIVTHHYDPTILVCYELHWWNTNCKLLMIFVLITWWLMVPHEITFRMVDSCHPPPPYMLHKKRIVRVFFLMLYLLMPRKHSDDPFPVFFFFLFLGKLPGRCRIVAHRYDPTIIILFFMLRITLMKYDSKLLTIFVLIKWWWWFHIR